MIKKNGKTWYHLFGDGYIVLISILILGAVSTSIVISVLLLGLGSSKTSFALEQSYQAKALADACAEEALQQIQQSTGFSGSDTLTFGKGSCDYTVEQQGQNRSISTTGTVQNIIRKVSIQVDTVVPSLTIGSWQDIADF